MIRLKMVELCDNRNRLKVKMCEHTGFASFYVPKMEMTVEYLPEPAYSASGISQLPPSIAIMRSTFRSSAPCSHILFNSTSCFCLDYSLVHPLYLIYEVPMMPANIRHGRASAETRRQNTPIPPSLIEQPIHRGGLFGRPAAAHTPHSSKELQTHKF